MPVPAVAAETLAAVRKSPGNRVRVAVADIDGILRGKYLHKDKFESAIESGFGFCDVVFGWDCHDVCYDNTTITGWHKGFPDALARIDLGTHRKVPWDDNVDFFLGEFIVRSDAGDAPFPLDGRQVLKRVLKRAEKLGVMPMCGLEFEWFNFIETPQSWADKQGIGPTPLTPGMFGYSLLRAHHSREYFKALSEEMAAFGVPIEGLHTETGPGVYEAAIMFSEALEQADRGLLFKAGAKEIAARFGIMPSFMAKWSQQYPGCSGHCHQSLSDGKKNLFYDRQRPTRHEQAVRELSRGPGRGAARVRADVLADRQQLQAAGRRLLGAGEADVGIRQPDRELSRIGRIAEVDAARNPLPRLGRQLVPRDGRVHCRGTRRRREEPDARRAADRGHERRRGEHAACAAHADRDDADFPRLRPRARLVRRRFRRPLRRDPRLGMAPMARCGHRLGTQALFRDHMSTEGPSRGRPCERGEAQARRARPRAWAKADAHSRPLSFACDEAVACSPCGGSVAAPAASVGAVH